MSTIIRPAQARGYADHDWLKSYHSFSFAHYHDHAHMGFGPLRVINEDRVNPGAGFATHGHSDMEILSYVIEGALEHKDSLGTGSVIRPGDVQIMSAGTGIRHSEFNHSKVDPVHFLQIWIIPERQNITPRYDQMHFPQIDKQGRLCLIASQSAREGSVLIHQNVDIFASVLSAGEGVQHPLASGRKAWVQIVQGAAHINGLAGAAGDGFAIEDETAVTIAATMINTEIVLFDLPSTHNNG